VGSSPTPGTIACMITTFLPRAFRLAMLLSLASIPASTQSLPLLRPPAVPLISHDPYFSVWSMADHLNDAPTSHWTGKPNSLTALARIDGKTYQLMGKERGIETLEQRRLEVSPTRTLYQFAGAGVSIDLTFLTPAFPDDLGVLSRPLTYIEWRVSSSSGEYQVELYLDASSELVVNTPDQPVTWSRFQLDGQTVLRMGSREQPVLAKRGDDLRIDWNYLYMAANAPRDSPPPAHSMPTLSARFGVKAGFPTRTISPTALSRGAVPATCLPAV
jgi:Domain of unknown function (DUF5127)/Domain of unknown function (DUF4964)